MVRRCVLQATTAMDPTCGVHIDAPLSSVPCSNLWSVHRDVSMGDVTFILAVVIALRYGKIFRILDGKVFHKSN